MKKLIFLITAAVAVNCGSTHMNQVYNDIPNSIPGWNAAGADETYDRETLYNYINGGAELYLTYTFNEVFVRRFVNTDDPDMEIVLDVYDMGSSEEAYGIFSSEREDEEAGIGQDSEFGGGLLRFWKDRYFVSLVVLGDPNIAEPAMLELARAVAAVIPSTGTRPEILQRLPDEGRIERETRYFHAVQTLNNQYYIADENILGLGPDTECALTMYNRENETGFLLLVQYPDAQKAQQAYESFIDNYVPEARSAGSAIMENGRWTAVKTAGRQIAIVFEAPDSEWAANLLTGVTLTERQSP